MKTKLHVASKVVHEAMWRALRDSGTPGVEIISRWIDDPTDARDMVAWCLQDVARADATILYMREDERLGTALVEVGAALALRKRVLWVGPVGYYSVARTGAVERYSSLGQALLVLSATSHDAWQALVKGEGQS